MVVYILIFLLVAVVIAAANSTELSMNWWYVGGTYKIIAGITVGLLYKYYYIGPSDTWHLFQGSLLLNGVAEKDFYTYLRLIVSDDFSYLPEMTYEITMQPRSWLAMKIISVINFISGKSYWLTSAYLSLICFWGVSYLAQILERIVPGTAWAVMLSFAFYPSVAFWSAGILKETIMISLICFIVAFWLRLQFLSNELSVFNAIRLFFVWLFFGWILWKLRFHYAAVLFACMITYSVIELILYERPYWQKIATALLVITLPLLFFSSLDERWHLQNFLTELVASHDQMVKTSNHTNIIFYDQLQATLGSVLKNAPLALFSGFFCPLLPLQGNTLMYLAAIENTFLLVVSVIGLFLLIRYQPLKNNGSSKNLLILLILFYIVTLGVLVSISSPNLGTLIRYRVGFLPFYVFLLCLLYYRAFSKKKTVTK